MTSQCPADNSTEAIACLLRVVEANTTPGWDWNPLNFAVTASIGILALIIACITVFQQLLAAGPGRIKASNLAIGPFAIHSRSRFDRTEIALRTTARVPLITWDVVYHRIVRQKFRPKFDDVGGWRYQSRRPLTAGGQADGDSAYNGITTLGTTSIGERHQYDSTATWLTLLTALGLDDPTFFPLVQRVTDYLPTDVQAAPAAAELRCLAILAAIADSNAVIESSGPSSRFVTISADKSQLSFRDHQIMGTVAAYEAYEETAMLKVGDSPPLQFGAKFPILKFEDLDKCLQLASGRLAYADGRVPSSIDGQHDERGFMTLIRDLGKRSQGCQHDICIHAYQDWVTALRGIQERRRGWHLLKALKDIYMIVSLLAAERANLCRAFPRKVMMLREALQSILALDAFWSTDLTWQKVIQLQKLAYLTFWAQHCVPFAETVSASWVVEFKDLRSTITNPFLSISGKRPDFKEDKTLKLVQIIRAFVVKQTNPNDPMVAEIEEVAPSSQTTAQLLACMDEWLLRKGGSEASCCMLKMVYKLGSEARILTTARASFEQKDVLAEKASLSEVEQKLYRPKSRVNRVSIESVQELAAHWLNDLDMSMMLVLRGILFALLLNDGADTSILYGPEFRNSVVKML